MPNDRAISQLVLQVDANVAVAQRSLQDLARVVNQSAAQMNTSLAANDAAIGRNLSQHKQLGLAFNNARIGQMELTAAVTRSIDAYGAGASPLRILSMEMGRLTEAAGFLGGGAGNGVLGSMIRFIGGPWGIAMLLAGSVIAKLATSHKEAGDSVEALVDKMRKQAVAAGNSKIADEIWGHTIDGLIDKNEKLVESLKKRLEVEAAVDLATLDNAKREQLAANDALTHAQNVVNNLKAQLAATTSGPEAGGIGIGQGAVVGSGARAALLGQLTAAQEALTKAKLRATTANHALASSETTVGEAQGKALSDLSARAQRFGDLETDALRKLYAALNLGTGDIATVSGAFDTLKKAMGDAAGAGVHFDSTLTKAGALELSLLHGKITVADYAAAVQKLAKSLEAAADAAKNAKKGTGEFGKQISFADAESIAKGAGLTVTSGYRSTAHQAELYNDPSVRRPGNPVARPGTSAHEGVNGKWALDIAFADGLTADKLKKLYGDEGVTLSAVYKERGHFHIEGSRSQAASAEKAQQAGVVRGDRQQSAFDQASDRLDQELLQAKAQLGGDYRAQAALAAEQVDAEQKKLLDSVKDQEQLGKDTNYQQGITKAQGDILRSKVDELASTKKSVIAVKEYEQLLTNLQAAADQQYQFQIDDLKFADDMATTQSEHRKLQLEILDIVYQQRDSDLRALKASQLLAGNLEAAARTQADIDRLPTERAQDRRRTDLQTMDPLQAWMHQVPHDAATINEALKSIEVQGIEGLASGISDLISGTKTFGQVFKGIASEVITEIIQMTVKMLIFKAISAVAGAFGGGGGGGDAGAFTDVMNGGIPGFATGGMFSVGGNSGVDNNVLSINGVPRAMVSANENIAVVPRASRINMGGANGGSGGPIELVIRTVPSDDAWGKVEVISAQHARQAVKVSVDHTHDVVRMAARPRLMGGR